MEMDSQRRPDWALFLAFALPVGALLSRMFLSQELGTRPSMILFVMPVTLCAYLGGWRPGLVCTGFSALLAGFFLGTTFHISGSAGTLGIVEWGTFVFVGSVISYLAEHLHRSQERILRSEAQLAGIFNASMDAIITLDNAFTMLQINPATERMFGYNATQLLQRPVVKLIPQAEHERNLKILRSVADADASRTVTAGPATGLRADGGEFPVEATFSRLEIEGKPRFSLVLRDVSQRKAAENALRTREALYRGLFESLDEGVVLWNPDGRIATCNASAARILGYDVAEIVGLHYAEIPWRPHGPDEADFDPEKLSVAVIQRSGEPLRHRERQLTRRDGAQRWVMQTGLPLRLHHGDGPPHVIVAFTDITEQRQRTATIMQMADIVAHSQDAIVSKKLDGIITTWNPGAQTLFGYAPNEAIGQPFARLLIPQEARAGEQQIRECIARGERVAPFDLALLRKDGQSLQVSVTTSAVRDADQAIVGASIIARDITAQRRMEEAMRERDAAAEASRLKTEFLATMSHELRTPLTGVIGFTEYLATGQAGPLNDEQAESLDTIYKSSQHLLGLINSILDLSRIEADKMELMPEDFVVADAVDEVCDGLSPLAKKKRITVTRAIAAEVATATLDRGKFKQVLFNLLSNAVKFTDEGGSVGVEIIAQPARRLALRVTDSGIGIDPKDVDKLFKNFHQLDNSNTRRHEGAGLGLALTKKIVELQQGIITVESAPGKGSVFTVILPCAAA